MEYLNRIRSTVTSVAATVSSALPGNPLLREYEVLTQIASAGPGLSWKIYSGRKHSTKQSVALWLFEKKDIERWPRREKEIFGELLKRGISQLTRLRHPRLLVIEHTLEESRDSYVFCTEPIFASLANCLGRIDNMPSMVPSHLVDFQLLDVEIRHGLFHLAEALSFLHIDAKMLHRNLTPESVIVNERGAWKLAGFDFCLQGTPGSNGQTTFEMLEWDSNIMPCVQPTLDYLAPEYMVGGRCDMYSDIFALGILAYAVFHKGRAPFDHQNSIATFKKNANELKAIPPKLLANIPAEFRDDVKMCLNFTPDLRPDATQFSRIVYFDDALVKTLNYFESLCQMDNTQKSQFFKGLPNVLTKFPKRPLLQKILPYLCGEFTTPDLIPFILPSIFLIAEEATDAEFASIILPQLIPVFSMTRPYQIALMLLQKMELLLQKTPDDDVRKYVLPLVYNALGSDTTKIQELCLGIIPNVGKLVDRDSMKTQLLPKLLKLATEGSVLSVKVQSLVCIGKLLPTLETWMVSEQILPALPRINSKEPGVLMAVLGIYKLTFESNRFGIVKDQLAKSVLPFLIATSVENSLNLNQFDQFMILTRTMLDKVEKEQRSRLQQLSALQEDQRAVQDFSEVIGQTEAKKQMPKSLDGLSDLVSGAGQQNGGSTPVAGRSKTSGTGPLSLEDKKRLAAEQEQNIRLRTQSPLAPGAGPAPTASSSSASIGSSFMSPMTSSTASLLAPAISPSSGNRPSSASSSAIDLTAFLPPPSVQNPVIRPASSGAGGAGLINNFQQPMGAGYGGLGGLVAPPASANPVLRPMTASGFSGNSNFGANNSFGGMGGGSNFGNVSGSNLSGALGQQQQQPKVDLSAFDSLLAFPKKDQQPKPSTAKDPFADLLG